MSERVNTFVDFRGEFPKTDPREAIPGEEVATLLVAGLEQRGFPIHKVEAVDYERIIECHSGDVLFGVHVWIDWLEMDRWEICCPSTIGLFGWLFGRKDHDEHKRLLQAIDEILRQTSGVRDIRWFVGFEAVGYRERFPWYDGPFASE